MAFLYDSTHFFTYLQLVRSFIHFSYIFFLLLIKPFIYLSYTDTFLYWSQFVTTFYSLFLSVSLASNFKSSVYPFHIFPLPYIYFKVLLYPRYTSPLPYKPSTPCLRLALLHWAAPHLSITSHPIYALPTPCAAITYLLCILPLPHIPSTPVLHLAPLCHPIFTPIPHLCWACNCNEFMI